MTSLDFATLLHARPVRRGAWTAVCPCHGDKRPSLSLRDMGNRTAMKCFACGATGKDVMRRLGLPAKELFVDSDSMPPEVKARLRNEKHLRQLESLITQAIANQYFYDPEHRADWRATEDRARRELRALRDTLYPREKEMRQRKEKLERFVAKWGWTKLWELYLSSPKGQAVAEQWGLPCSKR